MLVKLSKANPIFPDAGAHRSTGSREQECRSAQEHREQGAGVQECTEAQGGGAHRSAGVCRLVCDVHAE